jgi:serine protease inhibitor
MCSTIHHSMQKALTWLRSKLGRRVDEHSTATAGAAAESCVESSACDVLCFDKLLAACGDDHDNYVCSPASIAHAMLLVAKGVDDDSVARREVLDFVGTESVPVVPNMATAMWCRETVAESFKEQVPDGVFPLTTADEVNAWVAAQTRGKITNIVRDVNPATTAIVVNAVYFKDTWRTPFDNDDWQNFTCYDGEVTTPLFMQQRLDNGAYGVTPWGVVVGVPYTTPGVQAWFAMANNCKHRLTAATWRQLMSSVTRMETVDVKMPKFKVDTRTNVMDVASRMGVRGVFEPGAALWTPMFGAAPAASRMHIGDALHQAFIDVNKTGTEAAAATAFEIVLQCGYIRPPPSASVVLNRPFYMVITSWDNTIVFVTRVMRV